MTYSIEFGSGADRVRIEGPEPAAVIQILRAFNETHNVTVKPSGHFYAHPQGDITWNPDKPADVKPTPDPAPLKWGAFVYDAAVDGKWLVSCGRSFLTQDSKKWNRANEPCGRFATRADALAALDRCTTPPPGWEETKA